MLLSGGLKFYPRRTNAMRLKNCLLCSIILIYGFSVSSVLAVETRQKEVSAADSKKILDRIRQKSIQNNKRVQVISYREDSATVILNSKTNEQVETHRVIQTRTKRRGEKDELEYHDYYKNGEKRPVTEIETRENEPVYSVFDDVDGAKRYHTEVLGIQLIDDTYCYHIKVIPLEETSKHFKGDMYFTEDALLLRRLKGTMGKMPFAVRSLNMTIEHTVVEGISVPTRSTVEVGIHVPIVYPNKKMIIQTVVSHHQISPPSE